MTGITDTLKQLFRRRTSSADVAAERLRIILAHERHGVSSPLIDQMREEIIQVVTKFVDVDPQNIEVRLTDEADIEMLEVTVPFNR
ncbi:cell division topological specificity factor MinE [candidate division KSB3 bacterium]|jgi:cell division topological specificity factor|uniref:Cell division topological specificity factor n=1 Tax=candidate division KSB3 bacterium TaxID=2044937 RepID=A0A9D5Q7D8_9BACT|nr:cell division topological specificity factor MinE [candidate division KSB3 bacterium]MBD3326775.1 cell division topological specificity factor MinE [candidate division KSB3 bacterium]